MNRVLPFRATTVALAGTAALSTAYVVRWHIAFYPTTLLEAAVVITLVVFIVEAYTARILPEWRTPFTLPAILFLVAGLISVAIAPDKRAAAGLFRAYLLEPIVFFFIAAVAIRTVRRALLLFAGLCVAGLVVAIPNIVVVLNAIAHHVPDVSIVPPVAIYQTANAVALFLVPLIAVAAALFVLRPSLRIPTGAFLFIALVATVLSFSRGGYLALAAVVVGLALAHPRRARLIPAVIVAAVIVALIPPVRRRLTVEINLADPHNSLQGRFRLWAATLRMLRDHPLFGTGLSSFQQSINGYRGDYTENLIYPHNLVLNFWAETGLLGLVSFIWLLVQGIRVPLSGLRSGLAEWRPIHLGVLLAMVAVIVHGMVDVPYFKNDLSLEFWALLSLTWSGVRWAGQESSERYTSTVR